MKNSSIRESASAMLEPYDDGEERRGGRRVEFETPNEDMFDESESLDEGRESVAKVTWDVKQPSQTVIKVLGVGGGGCNAVQSMVGQGFEGVEFYAINTDYQALQRVHVPNRIQIGENLTQGSGAGAVPSIGEQAAREAEDRIREIISGADMVFITAGLGGGTGTGAAPVIAEIARSMDILNVAIVTRPFHFEGPQRMRRAMEGYKKLSEHVDTMIAVLNDKLMEVVGPKTPLTEGFDIANQVLAQGIRAIADLIVQPGLINVDFRDVRTIMGETGGAVMGVGIGKGENRAVEAVRKACHSPLQEKIVIDGARGVLINITGPANMTMHEINEATSLVYEMADTEANVIFGVVIDENMHDAMRVTIIATGFPNNESPEDFSSTAHLRPRTHQIPIPGSEDEALREEDPLQTQTPAITRKREREDSGPVRPDWSSSENPLNAWEEKEEEAEEKTEDEHAKSESEDERYSIEEPSPGARAFSDSEPEGESPGSNDPYDPPALHRRRRQRFFE